MAYAHCLWKLIQTQIYFEYLINLLYGLDQLGNNKLSREIIPIHKLHIVMDDWRMILFRNLNASGNFTTLGEKLLNLIRYSL